MDKKGSIEVYQSGNVYGVRTFLKRFNVLGILDRTIDWLSRQDKKEYDYIIIEEIVIRGERSDREGNVKILVLGNYENRTPSYRVRGRLTDILKELIQDGFKLKDIVPRNKALEAYIQSCQKKKIRQNQDTIRYLENSMNCLEAEVGYIKGDPTLR